MPRITPSPHNSILTTRPKNPGRTSDRAPTRYIASLKTNQNEDKSRGDVTDGRRPKAANTPAIMQHPAGRDRSQTPHQPAPTGRKPKNPPTACLGPEHLRRSPRIRNPQSTQPHQPPPTPTGTRRRPDDHRPRDRACHIIHPGTHQTQPSADNDQTHPNKQPARHPTPTITEDQTRPEPQNPTANDHPSPQPTTLNHAGFGRDCFCWATAVAAVVF